MHSFALFNKARAEPPYVLVQIYKGSRGTLAAISKSDDLEDDCYSWPDPGCDAEAALSWASNYAGINAVNVYVQLDEVDWNSNWGTIIK